MSTQKPNDTPSTESLPAPADVFDSQAYKDAIEAGQALLADGSSKADAARAVFMALAKAPRAVVLKAFVEGASVTVKGAPTYFYNINRQMNKAKTR